MPHRRGTSLAVWWIGGLFFLTCLHLIRLSSYITPADKGGVVRKYNRGVCEVSFSRYIPSHWETRWRKNAHLWSASSQAYCNRIISDGNITKRALSQIKLLMDSPAPANYNLVGDDEGSQDQSIIFSKFVYERRCRARRPKASGRGSGMEEVEVELEPEIVESWIEPLIQGLVGPGSLCDGYNPNDKHETPLSRSSYHAYVPVSSVDHLVMGGNLYSYAEGISLRKSFGHSRVIMFDVGSMGFNYNSWFFFSTYERRGLPIDHAYVWESRLQIVPRRHFGQVPENYYLKYHFMYGLPEVDPSDPKYFWTLLREAVKPNDYVIVRMDSGVPELDSTLLMPLINDTALCGLVDELYFSSRHNLSLLQRYWTPRGGEPPSTSLSDAYNFHTTLRRRGIRTHAWL